MTNIEHIQLFLWPWPPVCLPRVSTSLENGQTWEAQNCTIEAHHTSNLWTYLEIERSKTQVEAHWAQAAASALVGLGHSPLMVWYGMKTKVTRPINAVRDNATYGDRQEFLWCNCESDTVVH